MRSFQLSSFGQKVHFLPPIAHLLPIVGVGQTGGSLAGKMTCHFGQRQESLGRERFRETDTTWGETVAQN